MDSNDFRLYHTIFVIYLSSHLNHSSASMKTHHLRLGLHLTHFAIELSTQRIGCFRKANAFVIVVNSYTTFSAYFCSTVTIERNTVTTQQLATIHTPQTKRVVVARTALSFLELWP